MNRMVKNAHGAWLEFFMDKAMDALGPAADDIARDIRREFEEAHPHFFLDDSDCEDGGQE